MTQFPYKIFITIRKGKDLPIADTFPLTSDPYVEIFLGERSIGKTKTIERNNNPIWKNEKFEIDVLSLKSTLILKIMDENKLTNPKLLGIVSILLSATQKSYKLVDGGGLIKPSGNLEVTIEVKKHDAIMVLRKELKRETDSSLLLFNEYRAFLVAKLGSTDMIESSLKDIIRNHNELDDRDIVLRDILTDIYQTALKSYGEPQELHGTCFVSRSSPQLFNSSLILFDNPFVPYRHAPIQENSIQLNLTNSETEFILLECPNRYIMWIWVAWIRKLHEIWSHDGSLLPKELNESFTGHFNKVTVYGKEASIHPSGQYTISVHEKYCLEEVSNNQINSKILIENVVNIVISSDSEIPQRNVVELTVNEIHLNNASLNSMAYPNDSLNIVLKGSEGFQYDGHCESITNGVRGMELLIEIPYKPSISNALDEEGATPMALQGVDCFIIKQNAEIPEFQNFFSYESLIRDCLVKNSSIDCTLDMNSNIELCLQNHRVTGLPSIEKLQKFVSVSIKKDCCIYLKYSLVNQSVLLVDKIQQSTAAVPFQSSSIWDDTVSFNDQQGIYLCSFVKIELFIGKIDISDLLVAVGYIPYNLFCTKECTHDFYLRRPSQSNCLLYADPSKLEDNGLGKITVTITKKMKPLKPFRPKCQLIGSKMLKDSTVFNTRYYAECVPSSTIMGGDEVVSSENYLMYASPESLILSDIHSHISTSDVEPITTSSSGNNIYSNSVERVEVIYENQKRSIAKNLDWSSSSALNVLGRPNYSDLFLNKVEQYDPPLDTCHPPTGYKWLSSWIVDIKPTTTDANGWIYGMSLGSISMDSNADHSKPYGKMARRRKWVRVAVPSTDLSEDHVNASRRCVDSDEILVNCFERKTQKSPIMIPWNQVDSVTCISPSILLVAIRVGKRVLWPGTYTFETTTMQMFISNCPSLELYHLINDRVSMSQIREDVRNLLKDCQYRLLYDLNLSRSFDNLDHSQDLSLSNSNTSQFQQVLLDASNEESQHGTVDSSTLLQKLALLLKSDQVSNVLFERKGIDQQNPGDFLVFRRIRMQLFIALLKDAGVSAEAINVAKIQHVINEDVSRCMQMASEELLGEVDSVYYEADHLIQCAQKRLIETIQRWNEYGGPLQYSLEALINGYLIEITEVWSVFFQESELWADKVRGLEKKVDLLKNFLDRNDSLSNIVNESILALTLNRPPNLSVYLNFGVLSNWFSKVLYTEVDCILKDVLFYWKTTRTKVLVKEEEGLNFHFPLPWLPFRDNQSGRFYTKISNDILIRMETYQDAQIDITSVPASFRLNIEQINTNLNLSFITTWLKLGEESERQLNYKLWCELDIEELNEYGQWLASVSNDSLEIISEQYVSKIKGSEKISPEEIQSEQSDSLFVHTETRRLTYLSYLKFYQVLYQSLDQISCIVFNDLLVNYEDTSDSKDFLNKWCKRQKEILSSRNQIGRTEETSNPLEINETFKHFLNGLKGAFLDIENFFSVNALVILIMICSEKLLVLYFHLLVKLKQLGTELNEWDYEQLVRDLLNIKSWVLSTVDQYCKSADLISVKTISDDQQVTEEEYFVKVPVLEALNSLFLSMETIMSFFMFNTSSEIFTAAFDSMSSLAILSEQHRSSLADLLETCLVLGLNITTSDLRSHEPKVDNPGFLNAVIRMLPFPMKNPVPSDDKVIQSNETFMKQFSIESNSDFKGNTSDLFKELDELDILEDENEKLLKDMLHILMPSVPLKEMNPHSHLYDKNSEKVATALRYINKLRHVKKTELKSNSKPFDGYNEFFHTPPPWILNRSPIKAALVCIPPIYRVFDPQLKGLSLDVQLKFSWLGSAPTIFFKKTGSNKLVRFQNSMKQLPTAFDVNRFNSSKNDNQKISISFDINYWNPIPKNPSSVKENSSTDHNAHIKFRGNLKIQKVTLENLFFLDVLSPIPRLAINVNNCSILLKDELKFDTNGRWSFTSDSKLIPVHDLGAYAKVSFQLYYKGLLVPDELIATASLQINTFAQESIQKGLNFKFNDSEKVKTGVELARKEKRSLPSCTVCMGSAYLGCMKRFYSIRPDDQFDHISNVDAFRRLKPGVAKRSFTHSNYESSKSITWNVKKHLKRAMNIKLVSKLEIITSLGLFIAMVIEVLPNTQRYNVIVILTITAAIKYQEYPKRSVRPQILISIIWAISSALDIWHLSENPEYSSGLKFAIILVLLMKCMLIGIFIRNTKDSHRVRRLLHRRLRLFCIPISQPRRIMRDVRGRLLTIGWIEITSAVAYMILYIISVTLLDYNVNILSSGTGESLSYFLFFKSISSVLVLLVILYDTDIILSLWYFGCMGFNQPLVRRHIGRQRLLLGGWPLAFSFAKDRYYILIFIKFLDFLYGIYGWTILQSTLTSKYSVIETKIKIFIGFCGYFLVLSDIWCPILIYSVSWLLNRLKLLKALNELMDSDDSEIDEFELRVDLNQFREEDQKKDIQNKQYSLKENDYRTGHRVVKGQELRKIFQNHKKFNLIHPHPDELRYYDHVMDAENDLIDERRPVDEMSYHPRREDDHAYKIGGRKTRSAVVNPLMIESSQGTNPSANHLFDGSMKRPAAPSTSHHSVSARQNGMSSDEKEDYLSDSEEDHHLMSHETSRLLNHHDEDPLDQGINLTNWFRKKKKNESLMVDDRKVHTVSRYDDIYDGNFTVQVSDSPLRLKQSNTTNGTENDSSNIRLHPRDHHKYLLQDRKTIKIHVRPSEGSIHGPTTIVDV